MIEKIKTITYEIRSHRFTTELSEAGKVIASPHEKDFRYFVNPEDDWPKHYIKRLTWHLQDVLKCMNAIKKEETEKKKKQNEPS